jgi:hypothetical protein
MKSSDLLLVGVLGLGALYFGNKLKDTIPTAAASYTNQVLERQFQNLQNSAQIAINNAANAPVNYLNQQAENLFYNNPYLAPLAGHPEWAYMTPAAGYF